MANVWWGINRKRRWFVAISLVCLVLIPLVGMLRAIGKNGSHRVHPGASPLTFDAPSCDLGLVPVGASQHVSFTYTNTSDEAVVIRQITRTCACLADIVYPTDAIHPTEAGTITINYHPAAGKRKYQILPLLSKGESTVLTLSSEGYYDIRLSAEGVDFGSVARESGETQVVLVEGDRELFDLGCIQIPADVPDWLQMGVGSIQKDANENPVTLSGYRQSRLCPMAEITLLVKPGSPFGRFSEQLVIDVVGQAGRERKLTLKCTGEVVPEVSSMPPRLILMGRQTGWERLRIQSINKPFRIREAHASHLEYDYPSTNELAYSVEVKVRKRSGASAGEDILSVYLEHPTMPKLEIPVRLVPDS